jgi:hypothetical protein
MTVSAANADVFYAEVLRNGQVWIVRDDDGFPAPEADGARDMPFWSTRTAPRGSADVLTPTTASSW